jgi:hypothetical protein
MAEETAMHAQVGDWLIVHSRHVDDGVRKGLILEVAHADGSPPYVVRWMDVDRSSVVFPGSDATILPGTGHAPEPAGGDRRRRRTAAAVGDR